MAVYESCETDVEGGGGRLFCKDEGRGEGGQWGPSPGAFEAKECNFRLLTWWCGALLASSVSAGFAVVHA